MLATTPRPEARRRMPIGLAVVLVVSVTGLAFTAGWFLRPDPVPEAESAARELAHLLEHPHPIADQAGDAREVAALYAEDARARDAVSGDSGQGRDWIAGGWQYMFAQGGTFAVDHVLTGDRWAALVTRWTSIDAEGEQRTTPMVLLLEVEDGLITSELDISPPY